MKPFKESIKKSEPTDLEREIEQGDIYFVNLPKQRFRKGLGKEMHGPHRCVVLQSADTIREMDYVIVAPISSAKEKPEGPSWVEIEAGVLKGIPKRSYLVCEQIRCVDKDRLESYVGKLSPAFVIMAQKILGFLCPSVLEFD